MSKPGNVGPQIDPTLTTRVVEFNDVEALRAALEPRDVAVVLMEPAMTNVGIVLPEPGLPGAGPRLCDETGTLLINDETHTFSAERRRLYARPGPAAGHRHHRQGARLAASPSAPTA